MTLVLVCFCLACGSSSLLSLCISERAWNMQTSELWPQSSWFFCFFGSAISNSPFPICGLWCSCSVWRQYLEGCWGGPEVYKVSVHGTSPRPGPRHQYVNQSQVPPALGHGHSEDSECWESDLFRVSISSLSDCMITDSPCSPTRYWTVMVHLRCQLD